MSPDQYKSVRVAILCVVLFLAACAKPTTSHCPGEEPFNPRRNIIHPVKVVAQPWFGRHQVYGLFTVPKRYEDENKYLITMSIRGLEGTFIVGEGGGKVDERDIVIEQGHYAKQVYVPTRMALWSLITGQFGELRSPCNWTLEFSERSK